METGSKLGNIFKMKIS